MRRLFLAVCCLVLATLAVGCGSSSPTANADSDGVIIATVAPTAANPAVASPIAAVEAGKTAPPTALPDGAPAPVPTAALLPVVEGRPTQGRWIDVDVARFQVQLMDGTRVMQTIGPVAVGAQVNTGAYESTQTGLFHVYAKTEALAFDAPYNTYISHWVGFDAEKANGFHSFLKDATGTVVNAGTGRISNGCIRTGAPEAIFSFAEIGMPVFVHL